MRRVLPILIVVVAVLLGLVASVGAVAVLFLV